MNETFKKVWSIVSTVLVVIVVLCAAFLMGSRIMGYQCYSVISGSMEPTYSVGDLIYVKEVDPSQIEIGDPVTFVLNEELQVATHRVIGVNEEKQVFYTKGDANEIPDSNPVHFKNVIGVPQFSIPLLGYVSKYIQTPPGMYVAFGVGALLVLLVFLPDIINKLFGVVSPRAAAAGGSGEGDALSEENRRLKEEMDALRAKLANKNGQDDTSDGDK